MSGILFEGTDQDIFWKDGNTTVTNDVRFLYQYLNWVAHGYRRLYGEPVCSVHPSVCSYDIRSALEVHGNRVDWPMGWIPEEL